MLVFGQLLVGDRFLCRNGLKFMKIRPVVDLFQDKVYNSVRIDYAKGDLDNIDLQEKVEMTQ